MKIIIEMDVKEIAALVLELQEQQDEQKAGEEQLAYLVATKEWRKKLRKLLDEQLAK